MDRVRFGVMGCAAFARRRMIPALLKSEGVELVAVASRDADKARTVAREFKIEALCGYESLIRRTDLEALYLPLPTGLHEDWVLPALEAGKHLLVEKAFAPNPATCERMLAAARKAGRLIRENILFPFHSQTRWLQEQLNAGIIGKVWLMNTTFSFPSLAPDDIRYRPELAGGALLDAGVYPIKAASLFLGEHLTCRGSSLHRDPNSGVDLGGTALFQNTQRQMAQIAFSFHSHYQCSCVFLGTDGKLTAERIFTPPPDFRPQVRVETPKSVKIYDLQEDDHALNAISDFVRVLRQGPEFEGEYELLKRQADLIAAVLEQSKR